MGKLKPFTKYGQGKFTSEEFRQLPFFGGKWCSKRRFRVARPLSTKHPIHLVLRSKHAKGGQSFLMPQNRKAISRLLFRLGGRWGVQIKNFANVGNHLHLLIQIKNLRTYKPFVCAVTGGIATIVTKGRKLSQKFWDYRPYSRIVRGLKTYLTVRDYVLINQYEGGGVTRCLATLLVKNGAIVESS